jgi:hypothetical protein
MRRGSGGDLQCAVLELEGRPTAYALYRMNWAFERGLQAGSVTVVEAIGDWPTAMHAIWRYLLDIDWMARVKASLLPLDHPLLLLMKEPRRLGFSLRDGVWVRLLDVKTALSARSYQDRGSVVIEVIDAFCPWNAGCWRIATMASTARTKPRLRGATSVRSALFISVASPGRGWCGLCVRRSWSPAPLHMRMQSSTQAAHPGVPRFFNRVRKNAGM